MNTLFQIIVKLRIIRLTPKWLEQKIASNDIEAVVFGLHYGMYNVRVPAVNYLKGMDSEISQKALAIAIDDPMKEVSITAMKSLESMKCSDSIIRRIDKRRQEWKQIETYKQNRLDSQGKPYMPKPKDRPSRKSFENLKQMLRKPMNSGKWF